jgi:hypothetical protein
VAAINAHTLNRKRGENSILTTQLEEKRKVLEIERKKYQVRLLSDMAFTTVSG